MDGRFELLGLWGWWLCECECESLLLVLVDAAVGIGRMDAAGARTAGIILMRRFLQVLP